MIKVFSKEKQNTVPIEDLSFSDDFYGKKALVVDDIAINREILIEVLRKAEIDTDSAADGKQALEIIGDEPEKYDIILMDVQMPQMNGLEATRRIRNIERNSKRVPIIAMTASALQSDIDKCKEAGMDGHLSKPLDVEKVYETLREYLKGTSKNSF